MERGAEKLRDGTGWAHSLASTDPNSKDSIRNLLTQTHIFIHVSLLQPAHENNKSNFALVDGQNVMGVQTEFPKVLESNEHSSYTGFPRGP